MKVLHLITSLFRGGAQMMLYKLVSKMDQGKFEIQVISLMDIGPIGKKIEKLGIPVRSLGMARGVPDPRMVFSLAERLRRDKPDVIQTWMYHADLLGGLSAKMAGGIPVVWNIRHSNLNSAKSKKRALITVKACALLSGFLPSKVVCCSYASKKSHVFYGYNENRMIVIANGFDLDAFSPNKDTREKARNQLGLNDEIIIIGLIARFDPQKDHENFFRAASILHTHYPKVHFLLCGDGITWNNARLNKWIYEGNLMEVTHLLGPRDDMPFLQAALDIASSSSYGEGFSNVIGEAMACGVPCVVTDVGDSARIVRNTGIVVPPGDAEALASALGRMIDLGEERKKLGILARKRMEENYSLENAVCQYEKTYECLARNASFM